MSYTGPERRKDRGKVYMGQERRKKTHLEYSGPERRKHPRIIRRFIVSYRILQEEDNVDISQTKNLSLGGMLLTTNRQFNPGTLLALQIRLPFDADPILLTAKVVESHQVTKGLIYDTRIQFLTVDEKHRKAISETVDYYSKKG
ncbi:MAG: PilZ domain-containing protein [Candidatus Omnitrophica bacterium]|nr:PilZ domain-containing protein [Candidatus Omnitrophota bacterium]MBU1870385.1 PilZ domain-containing protein [Candidatus Omnitrophota bacterium]